jgi:hypothetical protein
MKLTKIFSLSSLLFLFSIIIHAQVPTSGLVAYYPFDGNAKDMSGNGNDGTVYGPTLTMDRFGNANSAYNFDGIDDYIEVPRSNSIEPTSEFTISAWALVSSFSSRSIILNKRYSSTDPYNSYSMHISSSITGVNRYWESSVSTVSDVRGTSAVKTNTWCHIAEVYDGSKLYIYVNGSLENSVTATGNVSYISSNLLIGTAAKLSSQYMLGKIDDIRIYNKALASTDIVKLYQECADKVTITTEPQSQKVQPGSSATFSVTATGSKLNYLWQIEKNNAFENVTLGCQYSSDGKSLTIDPVSTKMFGSKFRVIVYNCMKSDTSRTIELIRDTPSVVKYDTVRVTDTAMVYDTTHITTYDTTVINILETHHIDVYDTTHVIVHDTIHVYDTIYTSVTDTLVIDAVLGVAPNTQTNKLKIYPNPAKDHLYIDNGSYTLMNYYSIEILNSQGQRVFHDFIDSQKMDIDLSTWTGKGLYILILHDKQNKPIEIRKIVLE